MVRFLAILVTTCLIGWFVAVQLGLIDRSSKFPDDRPLPPAANGGAPVEPDAELGNALFAGEALPKEPKIAGHRQGADPIILHGHITVLDKVDVASQVAGQLLFIGEEVPEGAAQVGGVAPFFRDPYQHALVEQGNRDIAKIYRRIYEGETIRDNQMVAMINPAKALNGVLEKQAKYSAANAEEDAARKVDEEAERRLRIEERTKSSELELSNARLTRIKTYQDFVAKREAVKVARIEMEMAEILLKQHEIRNSLPNKVAELKSIYKHRGEAVKEHEPVMQLYRVDTLKVDALAEVQFQNRLRQGIPVTIEPTREEAPQRVLRGHKGEINAVAFMQGATQPLVLSASEDGSVGVWSPAVAGMLGLLRHHRIEESRALDTPEPVRAMAVVPGQSLIVTGCGDGSLHLWDIAQLGTEKVRVTQVAGAHRDAITALAASPDGRFIASASTDGSIHLWQLDFAKAKSDDRNTQAKALTSYYQFEKSRDGKDRGHQGAVTSLAFTKQCTLISASRDNTIRIWDLHEKGVKLRGAPFVGRSGNVHQLGVADDGRWLLFDQGKTLQILSAADGRIVNTLQNTAGGSAFDTLAIFSHNSSLLLTGGLTEGRLQLWRSPDAVDRGFELRQYVTEERSPATCAAFGPADAKGLSGLFVSGAKDGNVFLWQAPSEAEIRDHRIPNVPLTTVHNNQEVGVRQMRISIDVPNPANKNQPNGQLVPGRPVTIVVE
jgi:WD40 repeat protein